VQLEVDSDAAYLMIPAAKSRIAGHFYVESTNSPFNYNKSPNNAPIHTDCRALKHIVCSATKAECDELFKNSQTAIEIRRILEALGHTQRPT